MLIYKRRGHLRVVSSKLKKEVFGFNMILDFEKLDLFFPPKNRLLPCMLEMPTINTQGKDNMCICTSYFGDNPTSRDSAEWILARGHIKVFDPYFKRSHTACSMLSKNVYLSNLLTKFVFCSCWKLGAPSEYCHVQQNKTEINKNCHERNSKTTNIIKHQPNLRALPGRATS